MKKVLFVAAATGFVVSVLVHLASFTPLPLLKVFPSVFCLHTGIFPIAVTVALTQKDFSTSLWNLKRELAVPLVCLFAYAAINFFLTISANQMGVPGEVAGQPVLESHGRIIAHLTATEYESHRNILVRGFSGHWMLFYFVLAAALWPVNSTGNDCKKEVLVQKIGGA